MHEYGDEQLLKRCPLNWFPFMVHKVSNDEMACLIKKGIAMTMQEYRVERKKHHEEAERELRRQEKEALAAAAGVGAASPALDGAFQGIVNGTGGRSSPQLSRQSSVGDRHAGGRASPAP